MITAIDLTSPFIWFFFFWTALRIIWNAWLSWRDHDYVLKNEKETPSKLQNLHAYAKEIFSAERLRKSLEYERTLVAFGMFEKKVMHLVAFGALIFGLFPWLLQVAMGSFGLPAWLAIATIPIVLSIASDVISLPFDYHSTFTLEDRFGFNNSTVKLFFQDFFKNIGICSVIQFILGTGTFFAFYAIFKWYGAFDVWACLVLAVVSLLLAMLYEPVYDKVILPLFNEMKPMEDGPLKKRMEDLLKQFGYNPSGVFVVDASKRSKHSNAYCAGWGKNKRLVLFDTLLKNFTNDELMAILGHELAHSKLNHLVWNRVMDFAGTFCRLLVASVCISKWCIPMLKAFGFGDSILVNFVHYSLTDPTMMFAATTMLGFGVFRKLWDAVSWIFGGIESWISRKMEFAADEYSCKYNKNSEAMITSLFKLYGENLSYPVSDPMYEAWNFSHPSLVNRVEALKKVEVK